MAIAVFISFSKGEAGADGHPPSPLGPARVEAFVEVFSRQGFVLKDSIRGDLNRDSLSDLILVFTKKAGPESADADSVEPRPIAGLLGAGGGLYAQAFVNRSAVLCGACGTGLLDPYSGTVIKQGFFSLEQSGSTTTMDWKRITTFRYADSLKSWILHKDGMVSRDIHDNQRPTPKTRTVIRTRKDFGSIPIDSFDIYALDNHYADIDSGKIFPVSEGPPVSYLPGHRVKSGIWNVLDYCADRVRQRYLFFLKSEGDAFESASESDLSVSYELILNRPKADTCGGLAFRDLPGINPGKIPRAKFDSALNAYYLGKDTVAYPLLRDSANPQLWHWIFRRGQDAQASSRTEFANEQNPPAILYCGDLNRDGFLDFIAKFESTVEQTVLYLSERDANGKARMERAGEIVFAE
ncbi:MAG: hypothetical protein JF616_08800 [Fibrobacteres bacterium]|nr:hypothetical protein [Fibrobacterota bacterium]